ncbi:unnamed protein product [Amoebophrya sp. A25]|nr:unnamed protein product [Amoebophrya sp. A25]|eukprot:GSA25T00002055001.1
MLCNNTSHLRLKRLSRLFHSSRESSRTRYLYLSESRQQDSPTRNGKMGYDWRQHVEASKDPEVNRRIRAHIETFKTSSERSEQLPPNVRGRECNSYKQICKELQVGFVKNGRFYEMVKVGGAGGSGAGGGHAERQPKETNEEFSMRLWKDVWLFFFKHNMVGLDLRSTASPGAESGHMVETDADCEGSGGAMCAVEEIDETVETLQKLLDTDFLSSSDEEDGNGEDVDMNASRAKWKTSSTRDAPAVSSSSGRRNQAISLGAGKTNTTADSSTSEEKTDESHEFFDAATIEACPWVATQKFLNHVKVNSQDLWSRLSVVGVNNCSGKKLVQPDVASYVSRFFEMYGANRKGVAENIRPKRLRVAVRKQNSPLSGPPVTIERSDLQWGDSSAAGRLDDVRYAKPVLFADAKQLDGLTKSLTQALGSKHAAEILQRNGLESTSSKMNGKQVANSPFNAAVAADGVSARKRSYSGGEMSDNEDDEAEDAIYDAFNRRWRASVRRRVRPADPMYEERKNTLRSRLPAFRMADEFVQMVADNDVVILCGATGCGKTTQLPQMLMERLQEITSSSLAGPLTGRIVCTQPRRISATSVAERVCYERNEKVGDRVAYQIRFENNASDSTELLYCTTGILLRFLVHNPMLEGVSVVILDEVHERGTHTDFVLLILRNLLHQRRGDFRVVLMSATIDASNFRQYFEVSNIEASIAVTREQDSHLGTPEEEYLSVAQLDIPGKTNYPIEEHFIEDIMPELGRDYNYTVSMPSQVKQSRLRNTWATPAAVRDQVLAGHRTAMEPRGVEQISTFMQRPLDLDCKLIASVLELIEDSEGPEALVTSSNGEGGAKKFHLGSVLIFAPGWKEITDVVKELQGRLAQVRRKRSGQQHWSSEREWLLLPLHSMVPPQDQNRIFDPPRDSHTRKIIVSTNLAETSITVEDVVYVIDSGLCRGTTYTAETNVASLETFAVARSNVQQRRGRAGRCRPGQMFKLYTEFEFKNDMRDHELPEMLRTPVEELCLQVKAQKLPGQVKSILRKAPDPPKDAAVDNAVALLLNLGALQLRKPSKAYLGEKLTSLGWQLNQLPIHPTLGKMLLLGSLFSQYTHAPEENALLDLLCSICATLSFKSPFTLPMGKEKEADSARKYYGQGLMSDHLCFARVCNEWSNDSSRQSRVREWLDVNFLSGKTLESTEKTKQDLQTHLRDLRKRESSKMVADWGYDDSLDFYEYDADSRYTPTHWNASSTSSTAAASSSASALSTHQKAWQFWKDLQRVSSGKRDKLKTDSQRDASQNPHMRLNLNLRDHTPVLMAIMSVSLNLSVLSTHNNKKGQLLSLVGGGVAECHPGSLVSQLPKRVGAGKLEKRTRYLPWGDKKVEVFQGEKVFLLGWFQRLKTSSLFLRDVSVFADPLAMLLLLPGVTREEKALFRVENPAGAVFKNSANFLLSAATPEVGDSLCRVRALLTGLFDVLLKGSAGKAKQRDACSPTQVAEVFARLSAVLHDSHALYRTDCAAIDHGAASSCNKKHYDAEEEKELARDVDEFGKAKKILPASLTAIVSSTAKPTNRTVPRYDSGNVDVPNEDSRAGEWNNDDQYYNYGGSNYEQEDDDMDGQSWQAENDSSKHYSWKEDKGWQNWKKNDKWYINDWTVEQHEENNDYSTTRLSNSGAGGATSSSSSWKSQRRASPKIEEAASWSASGQISYGCSGGASALHPSYAQQGEDETLPADYQQQPQVNSQRTHTQKTYGKRQEQWKRNHDKWGTSTNETGGKNPQGGKGQSGGLFSQDTSHSSTKQYYQQHGAKRWKRY